MLQKSPHQSNGFDCGVFLLEFMKYITMNKPFDFSCSDMPYFRNQLKNEFEKKIVENTLANPILQARVQSLDQLNTIKLKSPCKEKLVYSNRKKEVKTKKKNNPDMLTADCQGERQVTNKVIKFVNPSRKNLCFSNFLNVPKFQQILSNEEFKFQNNKRIFKELKRLFELNNYSKSSTLTLRSIVLEECERFGQLQRPFNDDNQHDTAEFLNSILEHLFRNQDTLTLKETLFGGLIQKTMFCQTQNCHQTDQLQIEPISEIIPIEFVGYTLQSCLENLFSPEEVVRRCEQCGGNNSTQVTTFIQEPATLILQLNRFRYSSIDGQAIKLHESLIFPPVIYLPSGCSYRLVATVNHLGETTNSGHYIALLYGHDTDRFTLVDDSSVIHSVEMNEVIS